MSLDQPWTKSSFCASSTCVEVGREGATYLMRDSKHPDQPPLRFTHPEWVEFLDSIRAGDLRVA